MKFVLLAAILLLGGCSMFSGRGVITSGNTRVQGIPDAGKPATLSQGETRSGVAIPANTPVKVVRIEAVAATEKTPFQPAREEVTFVPTFDTRLDSISTSLTANTGTVDTSIAMKRIQAGEDRILLYAALGAAIAAGFFFYIKYPTPALICGAASVVFFMAWRLSDLPTWFWAVGAVGLAAALFLYLGHKRGEGDGVKAAISGNLETPTPVPK